MSTLFFTVCSLRQYPQALALGESLRRHHPDWPFFIGLADQPERLPAGVPRPFPVVGAEALSIPDFQEMIEKYTWLEVLHALRPHFARYFLAQNPAADRLVFLGPESWVLAPLTDWLATLDAHAISLLPQRLAPPRDDRWPAERYFLNVGVYQGEAWALRRSPEAGRFLDWWSARLHEKGWLRLCEGYGLDQLWLNLVPAFFAPPLTWRHPGYGVGYANADERPLREANGCWFTGEASLSLVSWVGLDHQRLRWEPHRTDRALPAAWRSLAGQYVREVPLRVEADPAFGRPFLLPRTPRARYRFIRPLRRLMAWIERVPVPFLR